MEVPDGIDQANYELPQLKLVIIGDSSVGKTSLMNRFVFGVVSDLPASFVLNAFSISYKGTVGVNFLSKVVSVGDRQIHVLFCPIFPTHVFGARYRDTAGQERFESLGTSFFRGSDCCILCYDITRLSTFRNLVRKRDEFLHHCGPSDPDQYPFVVVGTKRDLEDQRQVPTEIAQIWCQRGGLDEITDSWVEDARRGRLADAADEFSVPIGFFETSSKDNTQVEDCFAYVVSKAVEDEKEVSFVPPVFRLQSDDDVGSSRRGCCGGRRRTIPDE